MRILLTGASGFAGAALLPRLLAEGHRVRALARDGERVRRALAYAGEAGLEDVELAIGDTVRGEGVSAAMRGIEVAYYLIHSMEPSAGPAAAGQAAWGRAAAVRGGAPVRGGTAIRGGTAGRGGTAVRGGRARRQRVAAVPAAVPFPTRERISAETFAQAARAAGVRRIVYLGGLLPHTGRPSTHLSSSYAVERILLDAVPDSVALRASIVIGARSRSFRFLVRLVERMRVLALPAWRRHRTQPIDERDVVQMLASCAHSELVGGRTLDVGGPEVLCYGEMVRRIAEAMLLARPAVGLPLDATPLTARLVAAITDERFELVSPLMEALTGDLLPAPDHAERLLDVELHSFDSAVERALRQWERIEPLAAR